MQIAIVCYTKKVGQLAAFRAVVSFVEQSMLGRSPTEAFQVDVMDDAHRVSGAAPAWKSVTWSSVRLQAGSDWLTT
jgi:hypothetical protein